MSYLGLYVQPARVLVLNCTLH